MSSKRMPPVDKFNLSLIDKFNLIDDAFNRIFSNLREVDGSPLDEESAACLSEAYAIADIFYELMSSNCTWREAKARYDSIVWG